MLALDAFVVSAGLTLYEIAQLLSELRLIFGRCRSASDYLVILVEMDRRTLRALLLQLVWAVMAFGAMVHTVVR